MRRGRRFSASREPDPVRVVAVLVIEDNESVPESTVNLLKD